MKTKKVDVLFVFAGIACAHWVLWVFPWVFLFEKFSPPSDWILWWDTAHLIGSGSFDKIYPGISLNLPFFFPPYFLCLLFPLQFLTKPLALLAITIFSGASLVLAFLILARIAPLHRADVLKVCAISLASASWTVMWPLGQFASFFLLLLCASLKLRMSKRSWQAGLLLSLLMIKPNIGLMFPLLFLIRGELKMLAGWVIGFGSLVLLSVSMFPAFLWGKYFPMLTTISSVLQVIPPWKHHTIHAFFRSIFPPEAQGTVFAAWAIIAVPLVLLTLFAWYSTREAEAFIPRLFGLAILSIVTCSPYLHHYDAIMVVLPAAIWVSGKEDFHFKCSSRILGMSFLAALFIQQVSVLYGQKAFSLVSIPLTICLVTEALDIIAKNRSSSSS